MGSLSRSSRTRGTVRYPPNAERIVTSGKLRELREELTSAGAFKHREAETWAKLLFLLSCGTGVVVVMFLVPWYWALAMIPLLAVFLTAGAMIGHEGGHASLSESRFRNELLIHLAFPVLAGLGALYWKDKHNVKHHGNPNVVGHDDDIDMWPMAGSRDEYERAPALQRWFQRQWQGITFWPLTFLLQAAMRFSSIKFLVRQAIKRGFDRAWAIDALALTAHFTCWLVIPSLFLPWLWVVGFYLLLWGTVGVMLSMVFLPAHTGLPYMVKPTYDGWLLQLQTTRNLNMSRFAGWWFIGLHHQVDHHLFPTIPHQNLPKASKIIRRWAKRNNLPYQSIDYWAGLAETSRFMFNSWNYRAYIQEESPAPTTAVA